MSLQSLPRGIDDPGPNGVGRVTTIFGKPSFSEPVKGDPGPIFEIVSAVPESVIWEKKKLNLVPSSPAWDSDG
jgi:hypothetical protein